MNKAKQFDPAVSPVETNTDNPKGYLYAYTYMNISDIFGNKRTRKVSLGSAHNIDLYNAKRLIEDARQNNNDVHAELSITL